MNGINVVKTNMKDCDSFNIEVFTNDGNLIATGSYNVRTNWAHITTTDDDSLLEDQIVEAIENRVVEIH